MNTTAYMFNYEEVYLFFLQWVQISQSYKLSDNERTEWGQLLSLGQVIPSMCWFPSICVCPAYLRLSDITTVVWKVPNSKPDNSITTIYNI